MRRREGEQDERDKEHHRDVQSKHVRKLDAQLAEADVKKLLAMAADDVAAAELPDRKGSA